MSEEYEEKDVYVLLDFQGKDTSRFLQRQGVYFRMLNLNENKPIVEIGEDVYEGVYDDAVGTNVYFEEIEDPPPNTNVFEGPTPITLQYLLKQTKILKMKKIGTKPKPVVDTGPTETVNIHIKDDYRVLLEKYENDKLNIDECVTGDAVIETNSEEEAASEQSDASEEEENPVEKNFQWKASRLPPRQNLKPDWFMAGRENATGSEENQAQQEQPAQAQINPMYLKYEKLQKLAEQPTRRIIIPETVENDKFEQPLHRVPKNDFIIWKNMVMQNVEQQTVNLDINKDKLDDFVDIQKSVQAGIVSPSDASPRTFSKEEKQELLSFKNFINVSPLMKLIMLQDFIQMEKASMRRTPEEKLDEVGEDGCTAKERLQLLINFKEELEAHIISRLQDVRASDESLQKLGDVKLNLPDGDELSDTDFSYSSDENYDDDEQPSDSKAEDDGMSSDLSEGEQHSKLEVEEEESSNVSDGEGATSTSINMERQDKDAT